MKINATRVRDLRTERSWSQEELALAAGLNLRTVQRIEKDAAASLQSKKALAAAFDVGVTDLDHEEAVEMTQYEFKTLEIEPNVGFLSGIKRDELPDFVGILNAEGQDGWSLVQILTPDLAQTMWAAKPGRFVALLQRPAPATTSAA